MENGYISEYTPNPTFVLSDGQALIDSTVIGLGIAQIYDRVALPYVQNGQLVPVLPATSVPGPLFMHSSLGTQNASQNSGSAGVSG